MSGSDCAVDLGCHTQGSSTCSPASIKLKHFVSTRTKHGVQPSKRTPLDSMECYCYLRNVQELLAEAKTPLGKMVGRTIQRTSDSFWSNGAMVEYHPNSTRDQSRLHHFWQERFTRNLPRFCLVCGENLRRYSGRRH